MDIFAAILSDPNVDPAFKNVLTRSHHRPRRFTGEPIITGFGSISDVGSDRYREVRDDEQADHRADERRAELYGDEA